MKSYEVPANAGSGPLKCIGVAYLSSIADQNNQLGFPVDELCRMAAHALDNIPYLVNIIGMPDYRVLFINKSMRAFLENVGCHITQDDIGKQAWDVFPSWNEAFYKVFDEVRVSKQPRRLRDLEYRVAGAPTYWDIAFVPYTDASGEVTSIMSIRINMTERRLAEEALRESEEKFETIAETATDVIISIDESSQILYVNSAAKSIFGYTPTELVGQDLTVLMPERLRHRHKQAIDEYIKTGKKKINWSGVEMPGLHKDGREIPVEISFGDYIKNSRHAFVGVVRDISERKKAEEERERLLREIRERAKELDCFYQVARLGQTRQIDTDTILQQVVQLLPPAYQYPEITEAQIMYQGKEYKTPSFRETPWMQSADIMIDDLKAGYITVAYLEERPQADEGPFLPEERYMIDTVAQSLESTFEREQAEAASHRSEENLRALFDFMPAAIFAYDRNAVILQVNPACERLYGYTKDQLVGRHISDIIGKPDNRAKTEEIAARVFAGETVQNIEWEDTRSDGSTVWVLSNITPVYDVSGRVSMAINLAMDITERKMAEERRKELTAHKRDFYRRTIFAATEGKLIITERSEISKLGEKCLGSWTIGSGEDIATIRNEVSRLAEEQGMDHIRIDDFVQCAGEASTNAFKHGGGGTASLYIASDGLLFVVSDNGRGIEAVVLPELALKRSYTTEVSLGIGYKMMIALADKVYLATGPNGTTVAVLMKPHADKITSLDSIIAAAPSVW